MVGVSVTVAVSVCVGVSEATRIPCAAACVSTTALLLEPYATTIAVDVAVALAVGVSVI